MLFIETSIFTKQIKDLVSDEEYRQLQQDLWYSLIEVTNQEWRWYS
jgi:hypothetical protein